MFPRPSAVAALLFAAPVVAATASVAIATAALSGGPAKAAETAKDAAPAPDAPFRSIEGGDLSLSAYRGGPVLLVNTASMCGFTHQYDGLQKLWDEHREAGLTVLAVPSDAFNQEYADNGEVKEFCEVNFGLTLPMTEVTDVKGADAHPVYKWLRESHGFTPGWNFNKVLLDGEGRFVKAWGSGARPTGGEIERAVEAVLGAAG